VARARPWPGARPPLSPPRLWNALPPRPSWASRTVAPCGLCATSGTLSGRRARLYPCTTRYYCSFQVQSYLIFSDYTQPTPAPAPSPRKPICLHAPWRQQSRKIRAPYALATPEVSTWRFFAQRQGDAIRHVWPSPPMRRGPLEASSTRFWPSLSASLCVPAPCSPFFLLRSGPGDDVALDIRCVAGLGKSQKWVARAMKIPSFDQFRPYYANNVLENSHVAQFLARNQA